MSYTMKPAVGGNTIRAGILAEPAFAKVNLFLEITGRRENGYHEIDTVMQTVSLADTVHLTVTPSEETAVTVSSSVKWLPTDRRNIAYLAAETLLREADVTAKVLLHIHKRIPSAAGLGGGSADAGAVLRGLNRLLSKPLTETQLCALGTSIGADVPFCTVGGCSRCQGIGEQFTPCASLPSCTLVIAMGNQRSSTPIAYGLLDQIGYPNGPLQTADATVAALEQGDLSGVAAAAYNAFETVILPRNNDAKAGRQCLGNLGSMLSLLSGSGAAVFGIFASPAQAKAAMQILRGKGYLAFLASPVGKLTVT